MKFFDLAILATALLQREKKLSYRALQREFELDDDCLEDLVFELIQVRRVALDHAGKILLWADTAAGAPATAAGDRVNPQPAGGMTAVTGELRQLTVLLCDMVGSTALSMKLDPEDLNEIIRTFQQTCAEVVGRFGGYVAKYMGDGMLVCYGYPQALENAAERAVRSALDIVKAMQSPASRFGQNTDIELSVRIGVATGPVVVDYNAAEAGASKQTFVGTALDIAQTLQDAAHPNSVLIADSTRQLIKDLFTQSAAGGYPLKESGETITAWWVQGLADVAAPEQAL
jgi:class 3 adenylate cyclase